MKEVGFNQSFNDFEFGSNSVTSLAAAIRFCRRGGRFQWHLEGAVDRVDTAGATTTGGRVGVGVYQLLTHPGASSSVGVGLTGRVGYEDFDLILFDPAGAPRREEGSRLTRSAEARVLFTHQDRLKGGNGFPVRIYRVDGSLAYVDKRSPGEGRPTFLTESFVMARVGLAFEPFLFHDSFGSRVEFRAQHERYFTDRSRVNGITTVRVQWRPQGNPDFDNPDLFALSAAYNFGDGGYSGWTLSLSKAF